MTMPLGRPMREVFGETVAAMADTDPRIVMLDGDLGTSTRGDIFEAAHPERYLQMGIAEQNMMGVAAGLATMGLIPFISTFAAFAAVRPLDQVRVLIAQTGLPVKITAGYTGLLTGKSGKTHQIVDDVAIMRAMPGMVTVSPADDIEAERVLRWCVGHGGPVYVRLTRDASQRCFDETYRFVFGRAVVMRDGSDITLIGTGAQTPRILEAADMLAAKGIEAHVLHVPTLKPLDVAAIVAAAERTGRVITVEEHTVIGGLGGAIAETLSEHRPTRVQRIGLQDTFTESGPNDGLLDLYGLSAGRVAGQVATMLANG